METVKHHLKLPCPSTWLGASGIKGIAHRLVVIDRDQHGECIIPQDRAAGGSRRDARGWPEVAIQVVAKTKLTGNKTKQAC